MTRADLKHCEKMADAREELNRSVIEGRIDLDVLLRVWNGLDQSHMI